MSACTSQGLQIYNWARLSPSAGHIWYLVERKWRYNTQWVDTNQMAPFPGRSLSAMQCMKRMTQKWQNPPKNNACCWQAVQFPADLLPSFGRSCVTCLHSSSVFVLHIIQKWNSKWILQDVQKPSFTCTTINNEGASRALRRSSKHQVQVTLTHPVGWASLKSR